MRKLITIILILVCSKSFAQVYQLMPQYGYQANRFVFDSTLQIPTTCGVPTLKSVQFVTKRAAIAFDSCNNRFYQYNPSTLAWSVVSGSGGSTDTTSLSNRINTKIDSIKSRNDSVFAYKLGVAYFQYKDTTIGTLQSVTNKGNTTTNAIYVEAVYANLGGGAVLGDDGVVTAQSISFVGGGTLQSYGTSSLFLPNYSDTLVGKDYVIDTLKRTNDSIFAYKNHQWVFQFKDSIGGGSSVANDTAKVVIAKVHNATGTTLQRGEVVYLFGANGDVASVKRANNKQDSTSSKTFGIVRRDIAAGDTGYITTQGQIEKLNLGAFTAGDILYLDSIDGQFTKVVPVAPYHSVFIGIVERANNGNGLMYVKVQNGYEISELHDLQINGKLNNQILVYSDTQKVWKNRNAYTIIDTTKLQQKSLPPYSIMGNNTNAAANPTAVTFKDTSGTYTGTITWGNVAPTSLTATYRWVRIGRRVDLNITLVYANAGTNNQTLLLTMPSDAPTPAEPSGATGNSNYLYPVYSLVSTTLTTLSNVNTRGGIRKNSAGNGYEIFVNFTGLAATTAYITTTYWTN
jgi:hypothetical protein